MQERDSNIGEKEFLDIENDLITQIRPMVAEIKTNWLNVSNSEKTLCCFFEENLPKIINAKKSAHSQEMVTPRIKIAKRSGEVFQKLSESVPSLEISDHQTNADKTNTIVKIFCTFEEEIINSNNEVFKEAIAMMARETANQKKYQDWLTSDGILFKGSTEFKGDFIVNDKEKNSGKSGLAVTSYLITSVQTLPRIRLLLEAPQKKLEECYECLIGLLKKQPVLIENLKFKVLISNVSTALKHINKSLERANRAIYIVNRYQPVLEKEKSETIDFSKIAEDALNLADFDDFYIRYINNSVEDKTQRKIYPKDPYQLSKKEVTVSVLENNKVAVTIPINKVNNYAINFLKSFYSKKTDNLDKEIKDEKNNSFFELIIPNGDLYDAAVFIHAVCGFFVEVEESKLLSEPRIIKAINDSSGNKENKEKIAEKIFNELEFSLHKILTAYKKKPKHTPEKPNCKLADNLINFIDKINNSPKRPFLSDSYLNQLNKLLLLVNATCLAASINHRKTGGVPSLRKNLENCLSRFNEEKIEILQHLSEKEIKIEIEKHKLSIKQDHKDPELIIANITREHEQKAFNLEKTKLQQKQTELKEKISAIENKERELLTQQNNSDNKHKEFNQTEKNNEEFEKLNKLNQELIASKDGQIDLANKTLENNNKHLNLINLINLNKTIPADLKIKLINMAYKNPEYITNNKLEKIETLFMQLEVQTLRFSDYLNAYCARARLPFSDQGITFFSWFNHTQNGIDTAKKLISNWKKTCEQKKYINILSNLLINEFDHSVKEIPEQEPENVLEEIPQEISFEKILITAYEKTLNTVNKDAAGVLKDPENSQGNFRKHSAKTYIMTYIRENCSIIKNINKVKPSLNSQDDTGMMNELSKTHPCSAHMVDKSPNIKKITSISIQASNDSDRQRYAERLIKEYFPQNKRTILKK